MSTFEPKLDDPQQETGKLISVTSLVSPNNFRFAYEDDLEKHSKFVKDLEEKFDREILKKTVANAGEVSFPNFKNIENVPKKLKFLNLYKFLLLFFSF